MREKIEAILNKIRPSIAMDGGNIELVDFDEQTGVVRVRLMGACHGCPMAQFTLKDVVETSLCRFFPCVKQVVEAE